MDSLHSIFYWNRLKLLQSVTSSIISEENEIKLDALVFIPGPDGRNNPMAIRVLKYLFKGAIGADLFDDTLDTSLEALEDLVLIIQEDSVRIICTDAMKKAISRPLSIFPNVIEYHYLPHEEDDIDQFQLKKCFHFKKSILEIAPNGGNIGIAIPIGYDNIIDIESWPLLQSFALDDIFTPTGFFTARYNVVDITTQLETIFRVVDCFYVENAANVVNGAINQHMSQFLSVLDATTVSQRDRLTADEAISPLEVLYEFGEMDAAVALEQSLKPVLLFGPFTNFVGNAFGPKASKWRDFFPASSLHAVVEASEPATGIRWCRTYFLQQGVSSIIYHDALKLQTSLSGINIQSLESIEDSEVAIQELKSLSNISSALAVPTTASQNALQRLMSLYVKLWFNLRTLVFETFLQQNDVLAAAELIQQKLTEMMSISTTSTNCTSSTDAALESINLFPHEKLQLHMDCLNALGEIVSVNDVDDMGGVCWTYIRASIHGIIVPLGNQETAVTIAVGDTFLFSPLSQGRFDRTVDWRFSSSGGNLLPFINDAVCITHNIPYFQAFIGSGVEEEYLRLIQYCSKTSLTASPLNLGKPIELAGTNAMNVVVLSNHSIQPFFTSELRLFQEGFIITKINHLSSVPIPIHYNQDDVQQIWTIDTNDCFEEALRSLEKYNSSTSWRDLIYQQSDITLPRGILIIMELKNNHRHKQSGHTLNALHHALPIISLQSGKNSSTSVIALLFPHNDRAGSMVPSLLERWRPSLRMNDIEEYKGKATYTKINREILWSYLVFLDSLQIFSPSSPTLNPETASMTSTVASKAREILGNSLIRVNLKRDEEGKDRDEESGIDEENEHFSEFGKIMTFVHEFSLYGYPAYGSYPMRCIHAVAESRRLSSFDFSSLLFPSEEDLKTRDAEKLEPPLQILLIHGLFGTGVNIVAKQFSDQLIKASVDLLDLTPSTKGSMFGTAMIDLTSFIDLYSIEELQKKTENEVGQLLHDFLRELLSEEVKRLTTSSKKTGKRLKAVLTITVIDAPVVSFPFSRLLEAICAVTKAPITHVVSIMTPESILPTFSDESIVGKEKGEEKQQYDALDLFRGIGHETWRGKGFQSLHCYSSQSVIILDSSRTTTTKANSDSGSSSSLTAYQQIKQYVDRYQFNIVFLLRLSSFHLFFEEEDLQFYQQLLFPLSLLSPSAAAVLASSTNNTLVDTVVREGIPVKKALGFPTFDEIKEVESVKRSLAVKVFSAKSSYPLFQVFRYSNKQLFSNRIDSERQYFSLTLFLQLIQKIFPTSTAMFTNITYNWEHTNQKTKSEQRSNDKIPFFLKHAMKKVFQQTEYKEMISNYRTGLADRQKEEKKRTVSSTNGAVVPSSSLWDHIRTNAISLQAILVIDNERIQHHRSQKGTTSSTSYRVLIEANRGNILYRELSEDASTSLSEIKLIGTFDQTREVDDYLISLFQLTQQHYLAPKPLLTFEDFLSESEAKTMRGLASNAPPPYDLQKVFQVQNLSKYQSRELPSGFWYDGQFFVDHNGQRFEVRPDIPEILEDYIKEENEKRKNYNSWLQSLYL